MPNQRSDAKKDKHPALRWIEANGITRASAAEMLGVKPNYLNLVLDRRRSTTVRYAKLFHEVFGLSYDELMNVKVRLSPKEFAEQNADRKKVE